MHTCKEIAMYVNADALAHVCMHTYIPVPACIEFNVAMPCPAMQVAVDVEWWERDETCILEVGWSMYDNASMQMVSR